MTKPGASWNWPAILFVSLGLLILTAGYLATAQQQDEALDIHIHDTYLVMPAMLMPWALASICLVIALLYFAFRRLLHRPLSTALGVTHFAATALALFGVIATILWALNDAPQRYSSYSSDMHETLRLGHIISVFLITGLLGQGVFLFNIARSLLRPKQVSGS